MNYLNTGDGLCKLYVQARHIHDKYLFYLLDTQRSGQQYLRILCIFHLRIYSAYSLTRDAQPKIRKAPTNADSTLLMKCQTASSNP